MLQVVCCQRKKLSEASLVVDIQGAQAGQTDEWGVGAPHPDPDLGCLDPCSRSQGIYLTHPKHNPIDIIALDSSRVYFPKSGASEDCLYLNLYAPAHADTGSKLPVMLWLPGGAFETGSASIFNGSALAACEDVLVVSIQYRLRIFGFFNTGDQHAPGNWAFVDQMATLTRSQENIEFFGGDPHSVTIFGFQYLAPTWSLSGNSCRIANTCGCSASDSVALLQCLRTNSSKELLSINQKTKFFTPVVLMVFFFPDEPIDILSQKAFKPIPSIIGVSNHECGFLLPLHISAQYLNLVENEYFYNKHSLVEICSSFLDLLGDVFFLVPGLLTARYHREAATEEEKLLNRKMMRYWANFARTGNPNGEGVPLWPICSQTEQRLQLVNVTTGHKLKESEVEFQTESSP
ncbi:Carboxylesterase 5A [Manis javanica]|nr:Carboxylesterase 5A [Manis javanica]